MEKRNAFFPLSNFLDYCEKEMLYMSLFIHIECQFLREQLIQINYTLLPDDFKYESLEISFTFWHREEIQVVSMSRECSLTKDRQFDC